MIDNGKLKKIKKQNEDYKATIKSFGPDSSKIYKFQIAALKSEKNTRSKIGYGGGYNLDKNIEKIETKLTNYNNKINKKPLTSAEIDKAQAGMINRKKGGVVKTKKKK